MYSLLIDIEFIHRCIHNFSHRYKKIYLLNSSVKHVQIYKKKYNVIYI